MALLSLGTALPMDPAAAAEVEASEAVAIVGELGNDVCDASDVECALSLRQLRASALAPLAPVDEPQEADIEGGWPQAAALAETLHKKKNIKTAYHLTSPAICSLILAGGFKPGSKGWCGGAIYFAASYKSVWTKAIGIDSHTGCLLKVKVDMGRTKKMGPRCDQSMNAGTLAAMKADSIEFNPGDGTEYVIFDPSRVISMKKVWQDPKLSGNSNNLAPIRIRVLAEVAEEADDASSEAAKEDTA